MSGDGEGKDSGSGGSDFGPPVGDFGPPVSDFGPPLSDFGPPTTGGPDVGWKAESAPEKPGLTWRPAGEPAPEPPPSVPAPPPQFRAPDSSAFLDNQPRAPRPEPADMGEDRTVRLSTTDDETWWNQPTKSGEPPAPPAEPAQEPGLSWADDPIAKRLTPQSVSEALARPTKPKRPMGPIIAGSAAVVAVLVALTLTIVLMTGDDSDAESAQAPATTSAALSCPASKDGNVTVGNGPGDTASGAGAILGYQHAFYATRDGAKAHSFAAPGANLLPVADLQQVIDGEIPQGTTYCLRMTERESAVFDVDLTEHRPDGTTFVYRQTVQTVDQGGKHLILAILDR
ncbi:hypothetical protein [Nocardia cyriacigeorgica]|uniref:hypothetical protein n=1 Tax=Nocardia cyriacigeorgica TaxID=135487 RepID=UPI00211423F6|nr:hypothetical protein [Nocardia cyriacigeorgica]